MIVSSVISRPVQVSVLSNTYAVNVAALKAIDISEMAGNTQISVAGYYAPGDGGGGAFYYDSGSSTADNGGTVIAPDVGGGRWRRVYSGAVNVKWFGAKGDNTADDTASINTAASVALATGSGLVLPPVATAYRVSNTLDFTGIRVIDGRGAKIAGNFDGIDAVLVGGGGTNILTDAYITLKVANDADKSIVPGTRGIHFSGMDNSSLRLDVRGFDEGVWFEGITGRHWVGNRFEIVDFFNNGTHVHIDLAGDSYLISNQFAGGSYYIGTNQSSVANRGTFKLTVADTAAASENVVESPEIGFNGNSMGVGFAVLLAASITSNQNTSSIRFQNVRLEGYGTLANPAYLINVTDSIPIFSIYVHTQHLDGVSAATLIGVPDQKKVNIVVVDERNSPSVGVKTTRRVFAPLPFLPVEAGGYITIPNYTLYDTGVGTLAAPSGKLLARANCAMAAPGDGRLFANNGAAFVGRIMRRSTTGYFTMLKILNGRRQLAVIAYDAAGAVLGGTAPYYVQGAELYTGSSGGVNYYKIYSNWVWIHPDVVSFFISECSWSGATVLEGVTFENTFGSRIYEDKPAQSIAHVVSSSAIASYMPSGTILSIPPTGLLMASVANETTLSASAISGATTLTLTSVSNIQIGDRLVLELDATFNDGNILHRTSVSSIAGSDVTIENSLPSAAAAGKKVKTNRWLSIP